MLSKIVNKFQIEKREYPLMIRVGKYDNDIAMKSAKMWSETEPNSKLVMFNNAGRLVNMDTPDEFNRILEGFLRNTL